MKRIFLSLSIAISIGGCVPETANQPAPGAANQPRSVVYAYVGTMLRTVGLQPTSANGGVSGGARIEALTPGAPGEASGLQVGDIIVDVGEKPTPDSDTATQTLISMKPGSDAPLTVIRDGRRMNLLVHLTLRPADADKKLGAAIQARYDAERAAGETTAREERFWHQVAAFRMASNLTTYHFVSWERGNAMMNEAVATMAEMLRTMPAPPTPVEAERQNRRAIALLQSAKTDSDNDTAAIALGNALYEAPWLSDLWANAGLVTDKAGFVEAAHADLTRYLILVPTAGDAAAVRQKLAEQEILMDERKPWLTYQTVYNRDTLVFRGRTLTITSTKGSDPDEERRNAQGDVLAVGTIKGRQFTGKWIERSTDPDRIRCLGPQYEVEAQGAIDAQNQLVLSVLSSTFRASSCETVSKNWTVVRRYSPSN